MNPRFFEIKAGQNDGTFEGRLSVYGVKDAHGDIVDSGAFASTIRRNGGTLPLLLNHDPSQLVGTLELRDTATALEVFGRLVLSTTKAQEAYDLMKAGALKGLSIGFKTVREKMEAGIRRLLEVELFEGSLTPIPANREALVTGVKSSIATLRDFEGFLHRAGWSRSEAKKLAVGGWAGLGAADEGEDDTALLDWLRSQNRAA